MTKYKIQIKNNCLLLDLNESPDELENKILFCKKKNIFFTVESRDGFCHKINPNSIDLIEWTSEGKVDE